MQLQVFDYLQDARKVFSLSLAGIAIWLAFRLVQIFVWHPLSHFPGPRLAAFTTFYKAYIDCVAKSSFVHTLERLHEKYGKFLLNEPGGPCTKLILDIFVDLQAILCALGRMR